MLPILVGQGVTLAIHFHDIILLDTPTLYGKVNITRKLLGFPYRLPALFTHPCWLARLLYHPAIKVVSVASKCTARQATSCSSSRHPFEGEVLRLNNDGNASPYFPQLL